MSLACNNLLEVFQYYGKTPYVHFQLMFYYLNALLLLPPTPQ